MQNCVDRLSVVSSFGLRCEQSKYVDLDAKSMSDLEFG